MLHILKKNLHGKTISKIEEELKHQIPNTDNIVNVQVNQDAKDGYVEIEVIYEVLETIGVEDKIVF